jgi:DNA-binding NtrC family response regulator
MNKENIKLFLVDDDALFLKSLEIDFLQLPGFTVETYATGELCMNNITHDPNIVILDYSLDGLNKDAINGIETLDRIRSYDENIQVIMLSAQDKIDVAVSCMHHKAYDYVVKSETAFTRLQKIIATIVHFRKMEKQLNWYMDRM